MLFPTYKNEVHVTNLSLFNFYNFVSIECEMFIVEGIAELITDTMDATDSLVNVAMGMTVNPVVDAASCNIVCKFDGEGSVDVTSQKLRRHQLEGRYMMGNDNLMLGSTRGYRLLDKFKASFVFAIEIGKGEVVLAVENATEVADTMLCDIGILQGDIGPKCRYDDVDVLNMDNGIIVIVDIGANLAYESVVHGG